MWVHYSLALTPKDNHHDSHTLDGKNIVAFYLEVCGFKVYNLGKDVPPSVFVDEAEAKGAENKRVKR